MSKHKKLPQKNLSLKERLSKHWDNRNWDMFTALFSRDRDASMRTPWADRWNDALYNALTNALFADRNLSGAEAALALIDAERAAGIPPSLEDCACVASDFLKAHKNAFLKELSPLKQEERLPAVYASLRKGLASFVSSQSKERKEQKNGASALTEKFAAQCARLGRAKTLSPYTTWLKIAEQLEGLAKGTEHERTFSAIRAVTALIRELFRTGRGENSLRKPEFLIGSKLFRSIPQGQEHPAVKALWSYFCRAGEGKYGSEWGETARVAQMSFMADESMRPLTAQYNKLLESDERDLGTVALELIRNSSEWTEQEFYILCSIFVSEFECDVDTDYSDTTQFLQSFVQLARIGSKWRPEAPWTPGVQESFDFFLYSCPPEIAPMLLPQIPYEALSQYSLVMMSLMDARYFKTIEKTMQAKLPFRLDDERLTELGAYLADNMPSRWAIQALTSLLGQTSRDAVLVRLVREVMKAGVKAALTDEPELRQRWPEFSRGGLLEEIAKLLPPDNPTGCFCRLCSGVQPCRISTDLSLAEAFFASLPPIEAEAPDAENFFSLLLTWRDVPPEFLVRLFEKTSLFHDKDHTLYRGAEWFAVAMTLERMPNKENRAAVARGMLKLIAQSGMGQGRGPFKKAVEKLKLIGNAGRNDKNGKNDKNGRKNDVSPLGKVKSIIKGIIGQGSLPFEEEEGT